MGLNNSHVAINTKMGAVKLKFINYVRYMKTFMLIKPHKANEPAFSLYEKQRTKVPLLITIFHRAGGTMETGLLALNSTVPKKAEILNTIIFIPLR